MPRNFDTTTQNQTPANGNMYVQKVQLFSSALNQSQLNSLTK